MRPSSHFKRWAHGALSCGHGALASLLAVVSLTACDPMVDQPKQLPMDESQVFSDGRSARTPPQGTVAQGQMPVMDEYHTGRTADGQLLAQAPQPVTLQLLRAGQTAFDVNCAPCHGRTGEGNGMIVQRGFPAPPSYHIDRLRLAPDGHLFDVVSNGLGNMMGYASTVPVEQRWAIVAYVRALQLSQHAPAAALTQKELAQLEGEQR